MKSEPILITGVGQRVGLHLAQNFLMRGIPVLGTYRTQRDSIKELGNNGAKLYHCDFHDELELQNCIRSIVQNYQGLRAIIHNASEWMPDKQEDLTPAEIMHKMIQVHTSAPYQINLMLENLLLQSAHKYTDIIHIGDYISSRGSKKHIAYAASKAAQDNLTLSFSARLAPKVKVNSIAPALVLFKQDDDEIYREKTLKKSLMQREAGLDELQNAVDYLLQSQYVTGRILPVDGGRHLK